MIKIKRTNYNSAIISFAWVGIAFLFLGQTPLIDSPNVERAVTNWDYKDVMRVSQLIDQITYFKDPNTEFKNRYGGLLAPDNRTIAINQKILSDITLHLEKIREGANKKSVLKALESDFDNLNSLLLPPEYWGQIQEIKASVYHVQNKVQEIDAYSLSALALINSILPYIEKLIESDTQITAEKITDVYFKVKSTQATLDLFVSFIENSDEELLSSLIRESDVVFLLDFKKQYDYETYVKKNIEKIIADSDAIKEYQRIKKEYYLEHYENLEDRINNIYSHLKSIHGAIQNELNGFVDLANKKVGEYIQESDLFLNGAINESGEYIDIYPPETSVQSAKYWIRANIPTGTLRSLELQGKEIKNVPVSFSLVYKIEHRNNGRVLNPDSLLGGKIDQNDIANWKFNNLTAEIPLGFSVENVRLTKKPSEFLNIQVYSPSIQNERALSFNQVGIHLPEDGPWTNYKQLYEQQSEILSKIGVNEALGLEVTRVRISQDSLMPTLTVKLNSAGFLNSIIGSKNELNTFEINLGKLDESSDEILRSIKSEVHKEAEKRLNAALNSNKELLKEILLANSVDFAECKINNGVLIGKIKFTPKSFKIGDQVFPISQSELLFQSKFKEGKLNLKVSKPTLQYDAYIKKFLENELRKLQGLEELIPQINKNTVFFNIIQNIQFDNFQIDTGKKQITTRIRIDGYDKESLPVSINKDGIQAINGVDEFIKGYVTSQLLELVKPQFEEECQSFFSGTDDIIVFGEKFRLDKTPDCTNLNFTFKAEHVDYPDNFIEVLLQANGKVAIVSFNAPKVIVKLDSYIEGYLNLDLDYVKFLNPRFQKGKLVFDCSINIPILDLNETVGVVTLSHQSNGPPEISFEGATAETLIKQRINEKFVRELNKYIGEGKLQLEFTDEGDGIQITSVDEGSTDIFQKKIGMKAKITLVDLFEINPLNINLDIATGKISIEPITLENSVLASFKKQIEGEIVPGLHARIDVIPMTSPIRLVGDIQVNLHGMQFPSMGFKITKDKIEFHPNLSFPIPGALQIVPIGPSSPGLVLTNGNATLDLEKKQLRFGASMTVGEANTATENSRLINMRSSIASYYEGSRLGDFELQANVILVSVLNVMEGKGTIKTKEGCFKLEASTKGPLRDIFKFDQQVEMNCNPNLFLNRMNIDVIGLKNNLEISAIRNTSNNSVDLSGKTNYSLLGAKLGGGIETSLEINNPLSFAKNATANFGGRMEVNKFTLSGVDLVVNYYNASLDFTVLGMELGIGVPNIGDITEGKILEQILSMLDFDPKAVLEILKDPTKIKFKVAPMGVGESVKSSSRDGKEGKGPSDGNQSKNGTNTGSDIAGRKDIGSIVVPNGLPEEEKKEIENQISNQPGIPGFYPLRSIADINKDNKGKPKSNLSYIPKNLKGALELDFPRGSRYSYVSKTVSEKFIPQYEFGGYAERVTPIEFNRDSICYVFNNVKHCFPRIGLPNFNWGYAYNKQDEQFYLYLKWNPWRLFHFQGWNLANVTRKIWVNDIIQAGDKEFYLSGKVTRLQNFQESLTSDLINTSDLRFTSDIVFYRNDNEFLNVNGKGISKIKETGLKNRFLGISERSEYKLFYEYITADPNIAKIIVKDGIGYVVDKETSIYYNKKYTVEDFKKSYYENISILDSVWFKLDRRVLSGLGITETMLRSKTGNQNQLDRETKLKLNLIVNRIIRDPEAEPIYEKIIYKNKEYQIWNTSDSLVNEFINDYGNIISLNNSDLFKDLKVSGSFINLKDKLKDQDMLDISALSNLSNNFITSDYKYVSKKQDSLLFMNDDWDFLIQKKDTLVHLKNRIQSNSYNLYNELQDGNRVNKPKFLSDSVGNGLHASFISKVVSIISKDTTTTAKIENENGKLVGYFLSEKDFSVVWETDKHTIESMTIDRATIKSKILKNRINTFTDERIITLIDIDFSLEEIISYFKKGLTKTSFWYDNPNKIQSLIILL
jgi:hypothetical protein